MHARYRAMIPYEGVVGMFPHVEYALGRVHNRHHYCANAEALCTAATQFPLLISAAQGNLPMVKLLAPGCADHGRGAGGGPEAAAARDEPAD